MKRVPGKPSPIRTVVFCVKNLSVIVVIQPIVSRIIRLCKQVIMGINTRTNVRFINFLAFRPPIPIAILAQTREYPATGC